MAPNRADSPSSGRSRDVELFSPVARIVRMATTVAKDSSLIRSDRILVLVIRPREHNFALYFVSKQLLPRPRNLAS